MSYLSRETNRVKSIVVAVVIAAVLVGVAGAFATHMARNGFIRGPAAQFAPLVPSLAGFVFIAAFAIAPLVRSRLRVTFLRETPRAQPR